MCRCNGYSHFFGLRLLGRLSKHPGFKPDIEDSLRRLWRHLEPASRTYITLVSASNVQRIADLHVPILAALRERDPDRATAAYREHFEAAGKFVDETWEDDPASSRPVRVLNGTVRTADGEARPAALGRRVGRLSAESSIERRP